MSNIKDEWNEHKKWQFSQKMGKKSLQNMAFYSKWSLQEAEFTGENSIFLF